MSLMLLLPPVHIYGCFRWSTCLLMLKVRLHFWNVRTTTTTTTTTVILFTTLINLSFFRRASVVFVVNNPPSGNTFNFINVFGFLKHFEITKENH